MNRSLPSLACLGVLAAIPLSAPAAFPSQQGDANVDTILDVGDLLNLQNRIAASSDFSLECLDLNRNGVLDTADLAPLAQAIVNGTPLGACLGVTPTATANPTPSATAEPTATATSPPTATPTSAPTSTPEPTSTPGPEDIYIFLHQEVSFFRQPDPREPSTLSPRANSAVSFQRQAPVLPIEDRVPRLDWAVRFEKQEAVPPIEARRPYQFDVPSFRLETPIAP